MLINLIPDQIRFYSQQVLDSEVMPLDLHVAARQNT